MSNLRHEFRSGIGNACSRTTTLGLWVAVTHRCTIDRHHIKHKCGVEMNVKKGGMFGACIISVVLFVAIVGTVALDVQQETETVTKYKYITDTTGLFDYDKSPQYIDYDLVKNYTGYYTQDSQPYWGGVDYETEETVNRYVLNLTPISTIDEDKDLSSATLTDVNPPDPDELFRVTIIENGESAMENKPHMVSFADILDYYGISGYTTMTITTESGMALAQQSDLTHIVTSPLIGQTGYYVQYSDDLNANPTWTFLGETYQTKQLYRSCEINMTVGLATLYANADLTGASLSIETGNLCVIYHGTAGDFGSTIHLNGKELPPNEYLDIKQGVQVL